MINHSPIRIVIVDDHAVVRIGLAAFLQTQEDMKIVGYADSGQQALTVCAEAQPDVVLMDIVMYGMNGAKTTRLLREKYPQIKVLGLTSYEIDSLLAEMLNAGASGYLLKTATADELATAIREVAKNPPPVLDTLRS